VPDEKKEYDKEYFDRWYRSRERVTTPAELRRKVTFVVSAAEYFLRRPIKSVLDVGCGEGAWFPHLKALRRDVNYLGFDPSEYTVQRFGALRNIHPAAFGELDTLRLRKSFDLIICSDVLHYVPSDELHRGLATLVDLLDGLAFLEVLTIEDNVSGDLTGFQKRGGRWYRDAFRRAGLTPVGMHCYLGAALADRPATLELANIEGK
jgi:SAM-dependent methyltransferase